MKTNNRAIIAIILWQPFWCLFGCFFALCSTCCICFMQYNIVNAMDLWNVWYTNDDNQRLSYVNERHFGFMLIMS